LLPPGHDPGAYADDSLRCDVDIRLREVTGVNAAVDDALQRGADLRLTGPDPRILLAIDVLPHEAGLLVVDGRGVGR